MQYNTKRKGLILPEYGRHVQELVDYAKTIKDDKQRQDIVEQVIILMENINPNAKNVGDYEHKLWDHLYIISNFDLEYTSPYPKPSKEEVYEKPGKFPYPNQTIKYRHYGKNVESMIDKAMDMKDEDKQEAYTEIIASFMKRTYSNYNPDGVNDEIIKDDLVRMSDGELSLEDDQRIVVKRSTSKISNTSNNNNRNKRNNNNRNKRNNNNKYRKNRN